MNQFEFDSQAARLRKAYGPSAVNEEFLILIYRKFMRYEIGLFTGAVDQMIEERMPLKISVMSELIASRGRRLSHFVSESSEKITCSICSNAGIMFAASVDYGHRFFIRCSCEYGLSSDDSVPVWRESMKKDFRMEPLPLMKPDLSDLRKKFQELSDEEFTKRPEVARMIDSQIQEALIWWREQRRISNEFWSEYFAEKLNIT